MNSNRKALLRVFAGLSINFSAAWFGLVFITPIIEPAFPQLLFSLTKNVVLGIVFLYASFILEKQLTSYE